MTDIYDPNLFDNLNILIGGEELVVKRPNRNKGRANPRQPVKRADYIRDFARLPDIVLRELWLRGDIESLPTTESLSESLPADAMEMLGKIKERYKKVALWLAYNFLTKDELETEFGIDYQLVEYELFHTELIAFKGEAEYELATLKLIKEYRPKSLWAQRSFVSSEQQWYRIAMSNCWKELFEKNVLGNGQPPNIGKTEYVRKARRIDKQFRTSMIDRSDEKSPSINWAQNLETLFLDDAARIANDDDYFRENYWEPYFELRKQFWDEVEGNSEIQLEWITHWGQLFDTGNGKKIPKTKPKGFKPKHSDQRRPRGSQSRINIKKC